MGENQPLNSPENFDSDESKSTRINAKIEADLKILEENAAKEENRNMVLYEAVKITRREKNMDKLAKGYFNYFMQKYHQLKEKDSFKILPAILRANDNKFLNEINESNKPNPKLDREILAHFLLEQMYYNKNKMLKINQELDEKIGQRNEKKD